ncbi:MAG: hypothetical protein M3303_07075, partial [Gemmatimonadota bacterium]|nr:hypothetical protein [Gemmatimonadota bacterium]
MRADFGLRTADGSWRALAVRITVLAAALMACGSVVPAAVGAQEAHAPNPQTAHDDPAREVHRALGPADIIMPHITDAKHFEIPCVRGWGEWACSVHLPTWPVTIGGHTYDLGPTKHVLWMAIAATLTGVLLITTARAHTRHSHAAGRPRGFAAGLEAVMLYL